MSIDIEFIHLKDELREQYIKAHEELTAFKTIKTINLDVVSKSEREYIDLVVIDQSIDTATPTGRLMFNMLAAIAEFETDLRSERQLEGIAKAKEHGVKFGRPTKRTAERDLEIYNKREKGISIGFLAKEYDLGSATIYRILNDVLEKVSTEATKLSS
nr:recombinase family protein [Colwellia sp. C2M11]